MPFHGGLEINRKIRDGWNPLGLEGLHLLLVQAAPDGQALIQSKFMDVSFVQLNVLEDVGRVGGTYQGVGGVDDGKGGKTIFNALVRAIMKCDGVDERVGEAPDAHQVCAELGMGAAEAFAFGGGQVGGGLAEGGEQFGVLAGPFSEQHEFPDLVEYARGGTFINDILGALLADGDALGEAGNGDPVFPQNSAIGGGGILELGKDVHGENQSADQFGANEGDGLSGIGDGEAGAHEGRVGQLQDLGGHAGVFGDDVGDLFQ